MPPPNAGERSERVKLGVFSADDIRYADTPDKQRVGDERAMSRARGSRAASNFPTSLAVSTSGVLRRLALCRTH